MPLDHALPGAAQNGGVDGLLERADQLLNVGARPRLLEVVIEHPVLQRGKPIFFQDINGWHEIIPFLGHSFGLFFLLTGFGVT
jgi:hypothetical protein